MAAAPKRKLTVEEYLAIEEKAEFKSEFLDGEMFVMAGGTYDHDTICGNIRGELRTRLRGGPCRQQGADLMVLVEATGLRTYPDAMIICGRPEFETERRLVVTNPKVIFEVLSPSTERYDRTTKFRHYGTLPTLQEYVLVAQDEVLIERYVRQADGTWARAEFADPAGAFALTSVPVVIPVAEIYAGVEFPPLPPGRPGPPEGE